MDIKTILAMLARTGFKALAGFLIGHGYLQASGTEAFIGAGMVLAAGAWSFWNDYGSTIAKASLDVLRAKVLAAAARANANPALAPQAIAAVAAHVEDTAPKPAPAAPPVASVAILAIGFALLAWPGTAYAGVCDNVPPLACENWVRDTIAAWVPAAIFFGSFATASVIVLALWAWHRRLCVVVAVAAVSILAWGEPAGAQSRPFVPTGNLPKDIGNAVSGRDQPATTRGIDDLVSKLDTLSLPDFEFALAQAKATNNEVTQPCWEAWVTLIKARQAAALGADGQPLPLPDPHIITGIERISELLAILRPDSKISLACVQIANVAGKDAATVLAGIMSGGALGLFKLPIPIP